MKLRSILLGTAGASAAGFALMGSAGCESRRDQAMREIRDGFETRVVTDSLFMQTRPGIAHASLEKFPEQADDPAIVEAAVKRHGGGQLRFASERIRGDRTLMRGYIEMDGLAIAHASAEVKGDLDLARKAIANNPRALTGLIPEHQLLLGEDALRRTGKDTGRVYELLAGPARGDAGVTIAAVETMKASLADNKKLPESRRYDAGENWKMYSRGMFRAIRADAMSPLDRERLARVVFATYGSTPDLVQSNIVSDPTYRELVQARNETTNRQRLAELEQAARILRGQLPPQP